MSSLIAFKDHPHQAAKSGTHGQRQRQRKHGRRGADLEVSVPRVVRDQNGTVLAEVLHPVDVPP